MTSAMAASPGCFGYPNTLRHALFTVYEPDDASYNRRRGLQGKEDTMKVHDRRSAFTLIEVMIVVIILAALAAMVVPYLGELPNQAKRDITKVEIKEFEMVLTLFKLENGSFPKDLGALKSIPASVAGRTTPYYLKELNDQWDSPFKYRFPGSHNNTPGYDLHSIGPNKQDDNGANDDISNWKQD